MSSRPTLALAPRDSGDVDVFVSYCHADRARIEPLVRGLEANGLSVWCDTRLEAGQIFDAAITHALRAARIILVCWSRRSVESEWVRAEATEGRLRTALASCLLEPCVPFPPFNLVHHEDLTGWSGENDHSGWRRLAASIAQRLDGSLRRPNSRAPIACWNVRQRIRTNAIAATILSVFAAVQIVALQVSRSGEAAPGEEALGAVGDATLLAQDLSQSASPPDSELGSSPDAAVADLAVGDSLGAPTEPSPSDVPEEEASPDDTANSDGADILIAYSPGEVMPAADAIEALHAALAQSASQETVSALITYPAAEDQDLVTRRVRAITRVLAGLGVARDRIAVGEGEIAGETCTELRLQVRF